MAMKTKSYSKFMTGAVTAAMVASAVAPVAAAGQDVADTANKSFNDIGPDSSHYVNVIEARELGFLSGYGDGTFKPNKILNRGDVAKMLGKYVVATSGKTLDQYVADNNIADVANFNDVPNNGPDKELVTYSKIVKHANIFHGANNNLMPTKEMNRDQIAAVLVRAFDLKDKPGDTEVVDGANSAYVKEIEILLENGVSNANPYKPFNKTSRAQFASFLVRAYKVSEGMDPTKPLPDPEEPGVDWDGDFQVGISKKTLQADGRDNATVTFTFLKDGKVDTSMDDIVLGLKTTYGAFASEKVTVQNGVATVKLVSEQSNKDLRARIDATVVEAGAGNKDLIGNVAASAYVDFVVNDGVADALNLTNVEANQSDRLTLYFDRDVDLNDFAETLPATGEALFRIANQPELVTAEEAATKPAESVTLALRANDTPGNTDVNNTPSLKVTQPNKTDIRIKGLNPVKGNKKAIEVVLEKATPLNNNQSFRVESNYVDKNGVASQSAKESKLTDKRTPEATAVTNSGMKTIQVKFSEAIQAATITVDGGTKVISAGPTFGEFHPATFKDERDLATIKMADYLVAGGHSVNISNATDFAGNTSNHQTLDFTVAANTTKPATVKSEVTSPYQFSFFFNAPIVPYGGDVNEAPEIQVYDEANDAWVELNEFFAEREDIPAGQTFDKRWSADGKELVLEAKEDWREFFDTVDTQENYFNYEYRAVFNKDTLINNDNGLRNDRFVVELSREENAGSALTKQDKTSPTITGLAQISSNEYRVSLSEPVVLGGNEVPTFVGTGPDGKPVTITGDYIAKDYADALHKNEIYVGMDLQTLVDQGYGTDWTLTIRNLKDRSGNSTTTTSDVFTVNKTVINPLDTPFKVDNVVIYPVGDDQRDVVITFTEAVNYKSGDDNVLNLKNYTLNGETLPAGSQAIAGTPDANGNLTYLTIRLPEDALDTPSGTNILNIRRDIKSADGSVLEGPNEFVIPFNTTVPQP